VRKFEFSRFQSAVTAHIVAVEFQDLCVCVVLHPVVMATIKLIHIYYYYYDYNDYFQQ